MRHVFLISLLIIGLNAFAVPKHSEDYVTYHGYSVIRVVPHTEDQLILVHKLSESLNYEFDFWKPPTKLNKPIDIFSPPTMTRQLIAHLKKGSLMPVTKIRDFGKRVAEAQMEVASYKSEVDIDADSFDFYKYHPFADIMGYIQAVAKKYPNFVSISSIGKSLQNRDVQLLKIGYPSSTAKNALFIDAGIHAREWIAPATALYAINQWVTNTSYTDLLKAIDIYVAPSINPDGYEYSRTKDRNWRKSRSGPRQGCYGVDLNRNFAFKWMVAGASTNPCSETYAGPSAFSEIEATNLMKFLVPHNNTIKAYLTLHSYGEDILYPWGYATGTYPPDVNDLIALGHEMGNAIKAVHGTEYVVGDSGDALYPASGASDDYSKSIGIKYVYTVELRPGDGDNDDDEWYGFDLPAKFIKPTAEETFPALIAAANRVQNGPF
jgi:hypothetical protein